jgi:hypothetical protein
MSSGYRTAPSRRPSGRRWIIGLAVCASVLTFASTAAAQSPPSAIDQYVEDAPSAGGSTPKGNKPSTGGSGGAGSAPSGATKLPPRVQTEITKSGGQDAELLTRIATAPEYGAPTPGLKADKNRRAKGRGSSSAKRTGQTLGEVRGADPRTDVSAGDTLTAAVSAVQGGDAARLVALLLVLAAITIGALVTAGLRQRRRAL